MVKRTLKVDKAESDAERHSNFILYELFEVNAWKSIEI